MAPDLDALRADAVAAIEALGLFARVAPRGGPEQDAAALDELAWREGDDLVLELVVKAYHQEYLGHVNSLWWFLNYTLWVWPGYFVPVDRYGVGLELHARLRGVQPEAPPVFEAVYRVSPAETAQEHTPFDRELAGFLDVGALWNVETSLEESNWRAIERNVAPHARRRALLALLHDLAERVAAPLRGDDPRARERVLASLRKRFAVVVGVTGYADPRLGSAPHGAEDAARVAELLASPRGGGLVAGRDLHLLAGEAAPRADVLASIAAVASLAAPTDELLVYLAGRGATVPREEDGRGVPVFLPHDARADDLLASGLSFDELARALAAVRAERVLVLADVSFAGSAEGTRTLLTGAGASPPEPAAFEALVRGGERAALFAAQPAQAAHVLPGAAGGLFTQALLSGLRGAADALGDGRVELAELRDYLALEVPSRAGLEGFEQVPLAVGIAPTRSAPDDGEGEDAPAPVQWGIAWPR